MRKHNIGKIAGLMAAVAILATPQARATLTFTLEQGNTAISGYPGPYGTVEITRVDNNNATVTLTGLAAGAYKYSFGDGQTLALNLAGGGTFTISDLSGTTLGTGPANTPGAAVIGSYTVDVAGNADGWGQYNFRLDTFDGFNYSVTSLTFNLHTTSGAWTSEDAILQLNAAGYSVAGHIFIRNADGSNTGVTGFAVVPEPTTVIAGALLLLPFGASAMRVLRRKA